MISIITVVNNNNIFEQWLGSSLKMQEGIEYELITIDNTKNTYSSLEKAYMNGVMQAAGDWLMFVHPDVKFLKRRTLNEFLNKIEYYEKENKSIHLWGVAGVEDGSFSVLKYISTITHGEPPERINNSIGNRKYVVVQTVDACCFLIRKNVFKLYGFSKEYSGFHMLIEDLCLRINQNGNLCVVVPIELWHRSKGASLDYVYFKNAIRLLNNHPDIKFFNTTTMHGKVGFVYNTKLRIHLIKNLMVHYYKSIIK